ncbi:MgtC/SapB family protein [Hydrogenophaga sp. A37]|uniref:MgtC/SapB family protein n=1 Tax=Hydrogenophaga sp. A37 TaxID=1945864 RepID=UPI000985C497|nr:MgtC/SapB family protein [Hydrogenophaga sp. A37]OOG79045.1 magnesium transporter MgtC [Hydrogenophaga sp. A37]
MLSWEWMASFWSTPIVEANLVVFMNLLGALLLGLVVGYERSYHGRAAGMRTYGIVCMASAALTVFVGYSAYWYGGHGGETSVITDPTRVVQGIVTGIGFLGAGVIMKEGLSISGLTTAASIWASSAIGVLVGVGLYGAAILLTALSTALMVWGSRLESHLPSRHAIGISLRFGAAHAPTEAELAGWLKDCGYELAPGSIAIHVENALAQWHFVAVAIDRCSCWSLPRLAEQLGARPEVEVVGVAHARN